MTKRYVSEKPCNKCGQVKPVSEYYRAYTRKDGSITYGTSCKECAKAVNAKRNRELAKPIRTDETREKARLWGIQQRRKQGAKEFKSVVVDGKRPCRDCGEIKSIDDFDKTRTGATISYCKQCKNKRSSEWQKRTGYQKKKYWETRFLDILACPVCNKGFVQKDRKQKYCSAVCRTKKVQSDRRKRLQAKRPPKAKPGEKTCKECGETKAKAEFSKRVGLICDTCIPAHRARMHQKYKAYYKAKNRERELKKRGAAGTHTKKEWEALKVSQDYTCLCCGLREPEITLTRDHVIPIVAGGSDDISNIQGLCHGCNSKKSAKTIDYRK